MPKVVVLGSNAFSGQDLVDLLLVDAENQVIGISRSPEYADFRLRYKQRADLSHYTFRQFDMNTDMDAMLDFLDGERPSHIVNFAAQSEVAPSWQHPEHWFETNTVALAKFVNHMRGQDYLQRYVHISSPEAYGDCQGVVTETTSDNPTTPYAASKAAADMLISTYQRQYGFPAITIRATNVYGAHQQLFKIMPRAVIYIKDGRKIQLHGGGVAVKSYIHIRDVSRGELAALFNGRVGERYHLSPDEGVSVRRVVETICDRMGADFSECVDIVDERPGQDAAYVISSAKAREELGWQPTISLEDGLSDVVDWVEENWDVIRAEELEYVHKP